MVDAAMAGKPVVMSYISDTASSISSVSFTAVGTQINFGNVKVVGIGFSAVACSKRCQEAGGKYFIVRAKKDSIQNL